MNCNNPTAAALTLFYLTGIITMELQLCAQVDFCIFNRLHKWAMCRSIYAKHSWWQSLELSILASIQTWTQWMALGLQQEYSGELQAPWHRASFLDCGNCHVLPIKWRIYFYWVVLWLVSTPTKLVRSTQGLGIMSGKHLAVYCTTGPISVLGMEGNLRNALHRCRSNHWSDIYFIEVLFPQQC